MKYIIVLIIISVVVYLIYKIRETIRQQKLKQKKREEEELYRAELQKRRNEYWTKLPEFYKDISKNNLPELLRALENYLGFAEILNNPQKRSQVDDLREIRVLRDECHEEIEKYSGKNFLDFHYEDLHIKYLRNILNKR